VNLPLSSRRTTTATYSYCANALKVHDALALQFGGATDPSILETVAAALRLRDGLLES
jgi:hypothetical protein